MEPSQIALLGALAGATIFLGLPMGRLRRPAPRLKAALNGIAIGILVFLVWDILTHAWDPVDQALSAPDLPTALVGGLVLAAGVTAGMMLLVYYDKAMARRRQTRPLEMPAMVVTRRGSVEAESAAGTSRAASATGHDASKGAAPPVRPNQSEAAQLALMIAAGIGLHNFAEGLAIGNSAAAGELSFAVLLVVGFALHNATEGFGIVAPLAAAGERPSWARLALLGVIGGGPTLAGTVVGQSVVNDTLSIAFLGLAAGSVLYVIIELLAVARRAAPKELTAWSILAGLLVGFLTDAILVVAGA